VKTNRDEFWLGLFWFMAGVCGGAQLLLDDWLVSVMLAVFLTVALFGLLLLVAGLGE